MRKLPRAVMVLWFPLMAACPVLVAPDPGVAGAGDACDADRLCGDNLSCVDGRCVDNGASSSGGSSGTGSSSSSSSSSSGGGGEDAGVPECSIRLDCALDGRLDGRDCVEGRCVFVPCSDDSVCGSRACVNGQCADVVTCTGDRDCESGTVCEMEVCVAACGDDAECNTNGIPVNTCSEGRCRQRCFGDQTCLLNGGICEGNVCIPPQCAADGDCNDADLQCDNQRCVPFTACATDDVCEAEGPGRVCGPNGRCRQLDACTRDTDCADAVCTAGYCRPVEPCGSGGTCPDGTECVSNVCVTAPECRGNSDCTAPQLCRAGACQDPPTATVARVLIVSPAGLCDPVLDTLAGCELTVRPGDQVALSVIALDAAGRLIAGVSADWVTDASNVADVMAGPSSVTVLGGGMVAGSARITARSGNRTSPAVNVRNVGVSAAAVRVRVVEAGTGAALVGARVKVNAAEATVDAQGVAEFTAMQVQAPFTVSAFAADHDYLTLVDVPGPTLDALLPLATAEPVQTAGGIRGTVNLQNAPSQGEVSFALAGVSAPNVPGLSFGRLLGETFNTAVSLPVIGNQRIPLPGGITLSAELPVVGQQNIKSEFFALGTGGRRLAWTFGGRIPLTAVTGLIGLQGGAQAAVFALVPYLEGLTHGLQTGLALTDLPYVRDGDTDFDGISDVDGDGNENELVPDYAAFPQAPLTVRQEQTLRTSVAVAGAQMGQVLLVAGARVPGHGFVPLGMTSGTAAAAGTLSKMMKLAPRYGGLETGDYAVAAFTFGTGNILSLRTRAYETLPTSVDLGSLPATPTGGGFTPGTRTSAYTNPSAVDVVRVVVGGSTGRWRIYVAGNSGMRTVLAPSVPAGLPDHAQQGVSVEAVQVSAALRDAASQLKTLADPGVSGLQRLGEEAEGLARGNLQTR